jgi:hypothetical protein
MVNLETVQISVTQEKKKKIYIYNGYSRYFHLLFTFLSYLKYTMDVIIANEGFVFNHLEFR